MNNITFEQLPQAVSMLIEKVGLLTDKVEKVLGMTPQQHGECRTLLTLNEVAALLGKSASTIYAAPVAKLSVSFPFVWQSTAAPPGSSSDGRLSESGVRTSPVCPLAAAEGLI